MRNQNTVFTRSKSSTLLITTLTLTLTPSLVKTSLKRTNTAKVMAFKIWFWDYCNFLPRLSKQMM